jgi:hypothetical protein
VQPCDVFGLTILAQIIDLGIVVMHANIRRGDRVGAGFISVKDLDEVLKRLRLSRCGSGENGDGEGRHGHEFH